MPRFCIYAIIARAVEMFVRYWYARDVSVLNYCYSTGDSTNLLQQMASSPTAIKILPCIKMKCVSVFIDVQEFCFYDNIPIIIM